MKMDGPIPGQSLAREPRNAIMERPPEISDPNEAVEYYLERIANPEILDNILHTLEVGLPVDILAQAMLTTGVAQGIHNVDVSYVISSVVQEYITSTALEAEIDFKETFSNKDEKKEVQKSRVDTMLRKALDDTPEDEQDIGYQMVSDISDMVSSDIAASSPEDSDEEVEEVEEEVTESKPAGLMSRGQNNGK